jgi:hypothetical protein
VGGQGGRVGGGGIEAGSVVVAVEGVVTERERAQTARSAPAWVRRLSFLALAKSDSVEHGRGCAVCALVVWVGVYDMFAVGDEEAAGVVNERVSDNARQSGAADFGRLRRDTAWFAIGARESGNALV